ncbi:hypothetical protein PUNSTDRAFT_103737 [Punctularia strigosozonata HHB-11173 SS5]|uniref:uncharacterized protein n=1 Tax=Punctularia strigosozonata (strain HHB-11173) TaxID=741275 RepID=UPI0004418084|nr:uncharacterized protein PUNSTDRAFT_103737 [Punctularia strigosozonata HHB-11173 SS5]EIN07673.1 hypothetical protein PUNSTDRAFT_103737 [Punctularia strigosozonata HHB-11173 SS5]
MPTFELLVVGCGGGPYETNLSSYLLKPCDRRWDEPQGIVSLEAGSGVGALDLILKSKPGLLGTTVSAGQVYASVKCYLITHAHLDHVASLVISAGSLLGCQKRVYGHKDVLVDLENVFSDRLWPALATRDENDEQHKLLLTIIEADNQYKSICNDISTRIMPVSHGKNDTIGEQMFTGGWRRCPMRALTHRSGVYESSAYFIRHDPSGQEILFFGDVEPSSVSHNDLNTQIWRAAAKKIPASLSSIFIECSWPSGRKDEELYGHMTPEHLADELAILAGEVVKARKSAGASTGADPVRKKRKPNRAAAAHNELRGSLEGVAVYIMHCKDDLEGRFSEPVNQVIASQVRALVEAKGLGAVVIALEQGARIFI